jgi:hypothetical protein
MQKKKRVLGLTDFDWVVAFSVFYAIVCPPVCAPVALTLVIIAIRDFLRQVTLSASCFNEATYPDTFRVSGQRFTSPQALLPVRPTVGTD